MADAHVEHISTLDNLTEEQISQIAHNYDSNKQRIDIAPTPNQLLGRFTVVCMVLNRTIGSGIFTTPPKVLAGTGSVGGALLIWVFSGAIAICGTLCWLELGLSIPFRNIREDGTVREVCAPRTGGEKNFLEYIYRLPKRLMSCIFGIMFIFLGNISGNAVAFGIYTAIAAGRDPVYDKDNAYNKAWVNGFAILLLTVSALLHTVTRNGGVVVNNFFAVSKVLMVLVLAILGFVHAGGKYLQASGINEPAIPHLAIPSFNVTDVRINAASSTNFHNPFETQRHDVASVVDSFMFVLFSFTGFEQPFYVLSEVKSPRKVFPKYVLTGMVMALVLYTAINVSYFCVVPKEVYTTSPANSLNMAGAFLHYMFDNSYGPQVATRVMAGLTAFSIFGNVLVMTFTAARVKQEIAKECFIPFSLEIASGYTTPWAWFRNRGTRRPIAGPAGIDFDKHAEVSPIAALGLHWFTSILLVLVTIPLKPATQYSLLTLLYSYVYHNVIGVLVSGGLLWLKLDSIFRPKTGRQWSTKASENIPLFSPLHVVIYFASSAFLLVGAFLRPGSGSPYSTKVQGYAWFIAPTIGLASLSLGVFWWFGLHALQWKRRKVLKVIRWPCIVRDGDEYVQKAELIQRDWVDPTDAIDDGHEIFELQPGPAHGF